MNINRIIENIEDINQLKIIGEINEYGTKEVVQLFSIKDQLNGIGIECSLYAVYSLGNDGGEYWERFRIMHGDMIFNWNEYRNILSIYTHNYSNMKYITNSDYSQHCDKTLKNIGIINSRTKNNILKAIESAKQLDLKLQEISDERSNEVNTFLERYKTAFGSEYIRISKDGYISGLYSNGVLDYSFEILSGGYISQKLQVSYKIQSSEYIDIMLKMGR